MLNLTDERAQSARAAPGITPVDSSEKEAPVRELIWSSVLGEPLVDCLQQPMPGKKRLEYAIQATASVWMTFEQVHNVVSGDVDFDSFGMAPRRLAVTPGEWYASGMLTLLCRDLCRMNGAMYNSRTEWGFLQVDSATAGSGAVELDDLIFRWLSLPPEEVSTGRDGNYGSLKIDSAAVDYDTGAVGLDDLIFRRTNLPAGRVFRQAERRLYMA